MLHRLLDYDRFRRICDRVGAYLLSDMAHISGLVIIYFYKLFRQTGSNSRVVYSVICNALAVLKLEVLSLNPSEGMLSSGGWQ